MKTKVCVVIPTYNEKENIKDVLDTTFSNYEKFPELMKDIKLSVLVVDDNSPDGTSQIVKDYENPDVHLLEREKKEGLGAAYTAGFKHALSRLNPDILFEMDADLSHNPHRIPGMISKIKEGASLVIGSRYIEGGSTPKDWGIHRVLISRVANLYTKLVLGIKEVRDCTGGFRAIKSDVFKTISLDSLDVKGYAFQISLLFRVYSAGFTINA